MVLILCYHDVDPYVKNPWVIHPGLLQRHIVLLRHAGYRIVTLDEVDDPVNRGQKLAVLTFDDGRKGCHAYAAAALRRMNCRAMFYICSGFTDGQAPQSEAYTEFMTWDEIQDLADQRHVIGAHSVTHHGFDKLSNEEMRFEVTTSVERINTRVRQYAFNRRVSRCKHFALPYGDGGEAASKVVADCGLKTCVHTGDQVNTDSADPYAYKRMVIDSECTEEKFTAMLKSVEPEIGPPKFSFIVPTCIDGAALIDTVQSIRDFGSPDEIEIIVVNDSPYSIADSDCQLLEAAHAQLHYVSHLHIPTTRNYGASKATGDVLIFTDAHVCFAANYLIELRDSGVFDDKGIYGCKTQITSHYPTFRSIAANGMIEFNHNVNGPYYGWKVDVTDRFGTTPVTVEKPNWFAVPYVGACALAISRKLFNHLGGFDQNLKGIGSMEDLELALRCWSLGYTVRSTGLTGCVHFSAPRERPKSIFKPRPQDALGDARYIGEAENILMLLKAYYPDEMLQRVRDRFLSECNSPEKEEMQKAIMLATELVNTVTTEFTLTPKGLAELMTGSKLGC